MPPCKLGLTGFLSITVVTGVYTTHSMSGFLAFVIIFLSQVCLSKRPFLYDIIGSSEDFSKQWLLLIRISLKVWNCWLVLCSYKGQDSTICFSLLEEGSCTFLKFHF